MLKSSLHYYSKTYKLVKRHMSVRNTTSEDADAKNINKHVIHTTEYSDIYTKTLWKFMETLCR